MSKITKRAIVGKENLQNTDAGHAKSAPDFSKLHKQWDKKLQQGKAVKKRPLTSIQPFHLSQSKENESTKNEKVAQPRAPRESLPSNSQFKSGIPRFSKPPPKANISKTKKSGPDEGSKISTDVKNDLERVAVAGSGDKKWVCSGEKAVVISVPAKEQKNASKPVAKQSLLPQFTSNAKKAQNFDLDFQCDQDALDSIMNGKGIDAIAKSPARLSAKFGPTRREVGKKRVVPFHKPGPESRWSLSSKTAAPTPSKEAAKKRWSIYAPESRCSLSGKTGASIPSMEAAKKRWSIYNRDSFSTKTDLLTWLKHLAEEPSNSSKPVSETSLTSFSCIITNATSSVNVTSTCSVIPSATSTTVGRGEGKLKHGPTKGILKKTSLAIIQEGDASSLSVSENDCRRKTIDTKTPTRSKKNISFKGIDEKELSLNIDSVKKKSGNDKSSFTPSRAPQRATPSKNKSLGTPQRGTTPSKSKQLGTPQRGTPSKSKPVATPERGTPKSKAVTLTPQRSCTPSRPVNNEVAKLHDTTSNLDDLLDDEKFSEKKHVQWASDLTYLSPVDAPPANDLLEESMSVILQRKCAVQLFPQESCNESDISLMHTNVPSATTSKSDVSPIPCDNTISPINRQKQLANCPNPISNVSPRWMASLPSLSSKTASDFKDSIASMQNFMPTSSIPFSNIMINESISSPSRILATKSVTSHQIKYIIPAEQPLEDSKFQDSKKENEIPKETQKWADILGPVPYSAGSSCTVTSSQCATRFSVGDWSIVSSQKKKRKQRYSILDEIYGTKPPPSPTDNTCGNIITSITSDIPPSTLSTSSFLNDLSCLSTSVTYSNNVHTKLYGDANATPSYPVPHPEYPLITFSHERGTKNVFLGRDVDSDGDENSTGTTSFDQPSRLGRYVTTLLDSPATFKGATPLRPQDTEGAMSSLLQGTETIGDISSTDNAPPLGTLNVKLLQLQSPAVSNIYGGRFSLIENSNEAATLVRPKPPVDSLADITGSIDESNLDCTENEVCMVFSTPFKKELHNHILQVNSNVNTNITSNLEGSTLLVLSPNTPLKRFSHIGTSAFRPVVHVDEMELKGEQTDDTQISDQSKVYHQTLLSFRSNDSKLDDSELSLFDLNELKTYQSPDDPTRQINPLFVLLTNGDEKHFVPIKRESDATFLDTGS